MTYTAKETPSGEDRLKGIHTGLLDLRYGLFDNQKAVNELIEKLLGEVIELDIRLQAG